MHRRRAFRGHHTAAQEIGRAAAGDRAAPAAAPRRGRDAQRAEPGERFAEGPVMLGDEERQPEHAAPALPLGNNVVGFAAE